MSMNQEEGPGVAAAWGLAHQRCWEEDVRRREWLDRQLQREPKSCTYCDGALAQNNESGTCQAPECRARYKRETYETRAKRTHCGCGCGKKLGPGNKTGYSYHCAEGYRLSRKIRNGTWRREAPCLSST